MKRLFLCFNLFIFLICLYGNSMFSIETELWNTVHALYFRFYETHNRIPMSFDDFLVNLPARRSSNERNIHALIDSHINVRGWIFIYIRIDEEEFEFSIIDGNRTAIYKSKDDMIYYYINDTMEILNFLSPIKLAYFNQKL